MAHSILKLLACTCIRGLTALLLNDEGSQSPPVKVLVFGDSWGALGPSFTMIINMFAYHNISADVRSTAVSGTTSCQWAYQPANLAIAAYNSFPPTGPDFVWLTLGGNDLLLPEYVDCHTRASSFKDAARCSATSARAAANCISVLLDKFFESFPRAQVVQCGYDFSCMSQRCLPNQRWAFCRYNVSCYNNLGKRWASHLLDPLVARYPARQYSTVAVDGACQKSVGMPGVEVGYPNMRKGSPCRLFTGCDHPAPGSAASFTIGEAFWDGFFKKRIPGADVDLIRLKAPPEFRPVPGWQNQAPTDYEDVQCNKDWKPNLLDRDGAPPPCNRTSIENSEDGLRSSTPGQEPDPAELEIVSRAESDNFDTFY